MTNPPPMRGVGGGKRDEHGILLGDHRCTPPEIWQVALEALGVDTFDLDPAANEHSTVPAHAHCTGPKAGGADGLELEWWGDVFINFPFSEPNPWAAKIHREAERMLRPVLWSDEAEFPDKRPPRSMTILGPGDSAVTWWRAMRQVCDAWAMWPKRAHFPLPGQAKGSPPGPVHLWYIGPRSNRWRRIFESHGVPTEAGSVG